MFDSNHNSAQRQGVVLAVVLVVVILLAYGAYSFTQLMTSEAAATVMYEREAQARAFAESGIALAAAILIPPEEGTTVPNLYHNPGLFQGILMREAAYARGTGRTSLVAPMETDITRSSIRFGLIDESSKLNVNSLANWEIDDEQLRDVLLALPDMTIQMADAILDWIDEDEKPREYGAENEYYGTLDPPYEVNNRALQSLDELLLIRDVTAALLYGEDTNRNGLLDPNENDGELSLPWDNADNALQLGWSSYLTVHSREANRRPDGSPRIDVNQEDLAQLYDELVAEFDTETARFVTAFRMLGPDGAAGNADGSPGGADGRSAPGGGSGAPSGNGASGGGSSQTRDGLDISQGGQQSIESLYELVGATVTAPINGQEQELQSPWPNDPTRLAENLAQMLNTLSITSDSFIEGRVNINQASREVLLTIPDLSLQGEGNVQLVDSLTGAQTTVGDSTYDSDDLRSTTGWLLVDGLVDLEEMISLDKYLTGKGDVYRVQALGYFDEGGPMVRMEALIDATLFPPRIMWARELTDLGRGYSAGQM